MQLILIKHAMPAIKPATPPEDWLLSDEGRTASQRLADALRPYDLQQIITSTSPKAQETGRIAAEALGIPWQTQPNLHEHVRTNEPFSTKEIFQANVKQFFTTPDVLAFGEETAHQARQRFINAVEHCDLKQTTAIVAHGTVITLFATHFNPSLDAFDFWQRLGLPSFVAFTMPDYTIEAVNDTV